MSTQRFEYEKSKYWEITITNNNTIITYGAIGSSNPRAPSNKSHKSKEAAEKFANAKITEKIQKGYELVPVPVVVGGGLNNKRKTGDDGTSVDHSVKRGRVGGGTASSSTAGASSAGAGAATAAAVSRQSSSTTKTTTTTTAAAVAAVRRFECPTKFWEIEIKGRTTLISYGPISQTIGRSSNAEHGDVATAENFAAKKIREKLKKGYVEVEGRDVVSSAAASSSSSSGAAAKASSHSSSSSSFSAGAAMGFTNKTGPLEDGEDRQVEGSGMNPHTVSRRGDIYSCSCPSWRFQRINIAIRTCKHIRAIQGDRLENERTATAGNNNTPIPSLKSTKSSLPFSGGVMLANKYTPEKHGPLLSASQWWMSEKLDGLRAIWNGHTFLSRTGNKFYAPPQFVADFPPDVVLDGELFCGRGEFDLASGLVRSIGGTYDEWNGRVSYEVFDAPLMKGGFEERMEGVKAIAAGMKHARFVDQESVRDAAHVAERLASIEADDGEGLMLRRGGSAYEHKRSNVLLKVKSTHDAEATVIGHQAGKGKHSGKVGALLCRLATGQRFKVGTGLSDKERSNPPPVGTVITFGYFELNKGGVPRFPTFKRVFTGEMASSGDGGCAKVPSSDKGTENMAVKVKVNVKVKEVSQGGGDSTNNGADDGAGDESEQDSDLQRAIALSKVTAAATVGVADSDRNNVKRSDEVPSSGKGRAAVAKPPSTSAAITAAAGGKDDGSSSSEEDLFAARAHINQQMKEVSQGGDSADGGDGDGDSDESEEDSDLQRAIALSKVTAAAATAGVADSNKTNRNVVKRSDTDDGEGSDSSSDITKAIKLSLNSGDNNEDPNDNGDRDGKDNNDVSTVDPTEALSAEDIHTLTTLMGFTLIRAQKGLLNSTTGVNGAVEWLIAHQEDDDIDEPIAAVPT